ncbi:MAG: hypothetical protein MUE47_07810 [Acidobacteria bacterium]|nr:hypothetical protein [Acidobacteriota bacterium]
MGSPPFPAALRSLLKRAVEHPLGFQLLYRGHLESVAALFAVTPDAIEQARQWIADPERRGEFVGELLAARRFHTEHPEIDHIHGRGPAAPVPPRKTSDDLVEELRRLPDGLDFLFQAPPETIAVLFGVHPFAVHEARRRLSADAVPRAAGEAEPPRPRPARYRDAPGRAEEPGA